MLLSSAPQKILVPFANSGTKNTIPIPSQIGVTPGAASFTDGFPPLTLTPVASGGVPPYGADFNGILNALSQQLMYQAGGGLYAYDSTWSTDNGGYPKGATVLKSGGFGTWVSLIDNNTTNPDSAVTANWCDADSLHYAVDTGTANAYAVTVPASVPFLYDGLRIRFRAIHANTASSTLAVNGLTAATIYNAQHVALIGNEIVVGGDVEVVYNSTLTGFVVLECTGGAQQLPANSYGVTAQALTNSTVLSTTAFANQTGGVAGSVRNLKMSVTAASASATLTADEIIVETALGGAPIRLASFNKTINLGTTGAGGMDTGTAPVSGYVAIYAIYNPTTLTAALLAVNATSAAAPTIYGGANMPSGYTASALVSVWPTNASGQFVVAFQLDRCINTLLLTLLYTSTQQASPTSLSLSGSIPFNAKTVSGIVTINSTLAATCVSNLYGSSGLAGGQGVSSFVTAGNAISVNYALEILTPQTMYYTATVTAGTMTFVIYISGYTI